LELTKYLLLFELYYRLDIFNVHSSYTNCNLLVNRLIDNHIRHFWKWKMCVHNCRIFVVGCGLISWGLGCLYVGIMLNLIYSFSKLAKLEYWEGLIHLRLTYMVRTWISYIILSIIRNQFLGINKLMVSLLVYP